VDVRNGSAEHVSPSSRVPQKSAPDPKGRAGGAPNVPDKRGGSGRGGLPPLASQRGVSLVETVIASALLGIGVVGGLTAWDTATMSAGRAVRQAWATCVVRSELDAIISAQYATDRYAVPADLDAGGAVRVAVAPVTTGGRGAPGTPGEEQLVTVQAYDPQAPSTVLAQASALKTRAL